MTGRMLHRDRVPVYPDMTVNSQVPVCTRKTTVKTNTITISSKPLPPCPQPAPPAIEYEWSAEIPEGGLSRVAQQEGGGLATYHVRECTAEGEPSRSSFGKMTYMMLPSIGLGTGLSDSFSGQVENWDSEHSELRGREKGRSRLRVQLPPPPIGSSLEATRAPPREKSTLEFVIHAGDVIPLEAPPRTLEDSTGWESKRHTKSLDIGHSTEKGDENVSAPRVTLTVAEEIEWPDSLLDPFFQFQVGNSQNLDQTISKPSSPEPPFPMLDYTQPILIQNSRLPPVKQNRRVAVKRKPAPPARVYSLPITLAELNNSNSCDTAPMVTQLENLLPTDISEMRPPRTGPDPSWNFLGLRNENTMLPPRPHSSPPGSANPQNNLNTGMGFTSPSPPQRHIPVESLTEIHWRTLSSLDLTSYDELNIYLRSLSALAGASKCLTIPPLRASTSSSYYFDDSTAPNARVSCFSSYSYHSNLPSPSEYIAYPSPQFKYSLVPRPKLGAVELPGVAPVELPDTEVIRIFSNSHPSSNKTSMVNVGQLRLPSSSSSQPTIKELNVLLTASLRFPIRQQDMPCRTTILKGSRRVTFIWPRVCQSMTTSVDNTTKHSSLSGTHISSLAMSIDTALKLGSGKGLLNRKNSRRIRERGGSILRRRGRDVYLELVNLGHLVGEPHYEVFLNRLDGSVWFVLKSGTNATGPLEMGVFDQWLSNIIPGKQSARERVVAVRWADGLDCVDGMRGSCVGTKGKGMGVARQCTTGEVEVEVEYLEAVAELEGVEVYLGVAVEEEEDGWFAPEGW